MICKRRNFLQIVGEHQSLLITPPRGFDCVCRWRFLYAHIFMWRFVILNRKCSYCNDCLWKKRNRFKSQFQILFWFLTHVLRVKRYALLFVHICISTADLLKCCSVFALKRIWSSYTTNDAQVNTFALNTSNCGIWMTVYLLIYYKTFMAPNDIWFDV